MDHLVVVLRRTSCIAGPLYGSVALSRSSPGARLGIGVSPVVGRPAGLKFWFGSSSSSSLNAVGRGWTLLLTNDMPCLWLWLCRAGVEVVVGNAVGVDGSAQEPDKLAFVAWPVASELSAAARWTVMVLALTLQGQVKT